MKKHLSKSIEEYEINDGWSSRLFAKEATQLMRDLTTLGVAVKIGRTVVHMEKNCLKLKAYVHHNGRSKEHATITTDKGEELLTVHYTEFNKLEKYLKELYEAK